MKKPLFIYIGIFILLAGYGIYQSTDRVQRGMSTQEIILGENKLIVELARTSSEHARGLMHRRELAENAGMLFLFESSSLQTFWNKNTLIPLDVIWIRGDVVIGVDVLPTINEGLTTVSSPSEVDRVLEVNSGWAERHNIQIGARVW